MHSFGRTRTNGLNADGNGEKTCAKGSLSWELRGCGQVSGCCFGDYHIMRQYRFVGGLVAFQVHRTGRQCVDSIISGNKCGLGRTREGRGNERRER